jgi:hypothetical protein
MFSTGNFARVSSIFAGALSVLRRGVAGSSEKNSRSVPALTHTERRAAKDDSMSTQASVHSIDALKDLRTSLALFGEDVQSALGAVDMEIRRTVQWLQHDRRMYWQEQIKRRKEQVAQAQAEVFRRKLAQRPDYSPAYSEQKQLLAKAEASLRDAEARAAMVKKWEPALQLAVLEYRGTTRRINSIASGDVARSVVLLQKMIDALESYLRVTAPSGIAAASPLEGIVDTFMAEETARSEESDAESATTATAELPAAPETNAGGGNDERPSSSRGPHEVE